MRNLAIAAGLSALAFVSSPALAQSQEGPNDPYGYRAPLPYDRGYDLDQARTRAINNDERPAVEDANEQALMQSEEQTRTGGIDMAQYDTDMDRYHAALADRDRVIAANQAGYARQQQAYDNAMADWRMQVADCQNGISAACDAPAPDPANY